MKIFINGDEKELAEDLTLAELLVLLGLDDRRVAVECNGRILTPDEITAYRPSDGDRLEIVHFVGGG